MAHLFASLPHLGAGIGLRKEIAEETAAHNASIDAVEIITEKYFSGEGRESLARFSELFPIIPHGTSLSIGSAEELDKSFLGKVKSVCDSVRAPYYSDHLATTHLGEINITHLSPVWFTNESLRLVTDKVLRIQDVLGIPFALENIASFFDIPGADFSEEDFLSEVCARTDCGLLLDLTNVYINAYNKKRDPYAFLRGLPFERVLQIHLAGGVMRDHWFYDTHSEAIDGVNEGVWSLFEWVLPRAGNLKAVIIERDENLKDDFETMILKDVRRAQERMKTFSRQPRRY